MNNTLHTPGPWRIEPEEHAVVILCDAFVVADVYYEAGVSPGASTKEEAFANARLIAAAPQMLEALRAALEAMGDTYDARDAAGTEGEQLRDQIAEAIAAATGEPADY